MTLNIGIYQYNIGVMEATNTALHNVNKLHLKLYVNINIKL